MASKIDNQTPLPSAVGPPTPRTVARSGGDAGDAAAQPSGADSSDSLKLSGEAAGLVSAQREISAGAPNMDQAKIDALRSAIASGSYRINPQEIANRLIALERRLA